MIFNKNNKIILIGDSITDAGRIADPENVGSGYFRTIRDYFTIIAPELELEFINKGIGGDRVIDLEKRWQNDVIDLRPDWVSISIGINDVWRQLDQLEAEQIYPDYFREVYTNIIERTLEETNAKLILMEPTIIEESIDSPGNILLVEYIEIVRELAEKYDAILVPTNQNFTKILEQKIKLPLTTDGVHMTSIGDLLIAKTWIDTI